MIHGQTNEGFEGNEPKCCNGPTPKDFLGERFLHGFFPHSLGCTQIADNYISVGVYPESARSVNLSSSATTTTTAATSTTTSIATSTASTSESLSSFELSSTQSPPPLPNRYGSSGFRTALVDIIIPHMERFDPELLIISGLF